MSAEKQLDSCARCGTLIEMTSTRPPPAFEGGALDELVALTRSIVAPNLGVAAVWVCERRGMDPVAAFHVAAEVLDLCE